MGSGHFLTAVVDHLEARYMSFLDEHRMPEVSRELDLLRGAAYDALGDLADAVEIENSSLLRRLIARRCVYGVDLNPLSVELARVGMWIHTFVPGLPLSFLDHNLVVGNSLVGIGTIEEATAELISGDEQGSLFDDPLRDALRKAEEPLRRLANIADKTPADIGMARKAAEEARRAVEPVTGLFDLTVAARIGEAVLPMVASTDELRDLTLTLETSHAREVVRKLQALHFPVAFPEVFLRDRPGFDVLVGNPPWEEATVEKLGFWTLRFPGLKSLSQPRQRREVQRLEGERPDIAAEYENAVAEAETLRRLLLSGPYPGMGVGDPDLYKAFAWRFWALLREDGAVGVVLPRSALAAGGSEAWRKAVLEGGTFDDITTLLNSRGWVFDDAEHRYTIGLVAIRKGETNAGTLRIRGPYPSRARYDAGINNGPAEFSTEAFRTWTETAAFPLLPSPEAAEVFVKLRSHPRLDDDGGDWHARPTAELHATNDKRHMIIQEAPPYNSGNWRARPVREFDATNDKRHMITTDSPPGDAWPVYKGASFDLWKPDTGEYYAWADPAHVIEVLQDRRRNQQRNSRSAFSAFPLEWASDPTTLPCLHPRIAFRDIARATDTRTVRVALIPGNLVVTNKAPYFVWTRGDAADQAYLLGVLASIPLDWYARRFVEVGLNFHILNAFPVPRPKRENSLRAEVVEIAGRLAAADERFAVWAGEVGVPVGSVTDGNRADLLARLDAAVTLLYGLDEDDLRVIYSTFHEGWDYGPRLEAVLQHHQQLAPLAAGVRT